MTTSRLYARFVLPVLIDLAMRNKSVRAERARLLPLARGVVLEVGAGSGLNMPYYGASVERLYALDPSTELLRKAVGRGARSSFPIVPLCHPAEHIPLPDASIDSAVMTWTLCSIGDPLTALREIRRVLAPGGQLIFVEHGRAVDPVVIRWQDRLTPIWRRFAGGCHLNRPIDRMLADGGFAAPDLERGYVSGPRIGAYFYRGVARPRPDLTQRGELASLHGGRNEP
ncbi:MAG TPA: class I SAM-dependent methyltransferase [Methylomirabilota bacterium]|jgi:ubiquinone/menaquinone biosynthesis C-methylase UbiE